MIGKPSQPKPTENVQTVSGRLRTGMLFVIGTPIGSPNDLTIRAVDTLKRVPIVAAETPLFTQSLLAHHGIQTTITSYGPDNHREKIAILLHQLREGRDVALVSDNGMPVLYDPGRSLVTAVHRAGIPVTVIPGPSALTAAIALSGYSGDRIVFEGRLPTTRPPLLRFMARLKYEWRTAVFFLQSGSILAVLQSLAQVLPTRKITLAIDLTAPQEAYLRGTPSLLLRKIRSLHQDAKVTLVLQGNGRKGEDRKVTKRSRVYSFSRRRITTR